MKKRFPLLQVLGFLLIALSLGILLAQRFLVTESIKKNAAIAQQIQALLPEPQYGTTADYSGSEMPVLQIEGADYVCLLEVPALSVHLPVQNQWQAGILNTQPSRFWGSIYDGTLILGGGNQVGQFDFCARLDIGDQIILTDMQGTEFYCSVAQIDRSSSADFGKLSDEAYPLTLFVREEYDSRYIVVRCQWGH